MLSKVRAGTEVVIPETSKCMSIWGSFWREGNKGMKMRVLVLAAMFLPLICLGASAFNPSKALASGACPNYTDSSNTDYYCTGVTHLTSAGAISGYSCGAGCVFFGPYRTVSRSEFAKMITVYFGKCNPCDTSGGPHFADTPPTDPFYQWVEEAYHWGIISGYNGSGTNPCTGQTENPNLLYFRGCNTLVRRQMLKFTSNAAGFSDNTSNMSSPYADLSTADPFFSYIERSVMHATDVEWPPNDPSHPVCGYNYQPCFFPLASVLRADAAMQIFMARDLLNYGQEFAQRRESTTAGWDLVQAGASTPLYNSALAQGDFIAAPIAITDRYNGNFAEGGPEEWTNGTSVYYAPYYTWRSWTGNGFAQSTGYSLTPGVTHTFYLVNYNNQWQVNFCPSGCVQLALSGSLFQMPYAAVGAETSRLTLGSGTINISSFTLRVPGGSSYQTCYDVTQTPWFKMHSSPPSTCNYGNWSMSYVP